MLCALSQSAAMLEPDPRRREFVEAVLESLPEDPARRDLLETSVGLAASMPSPPQGDAPEKAAARMRETTRSFPRRRWMGQATWIAAAMLAAWFALLSPAAVQGLWSISDANLVTVGFTSSCCSDGPPRLPRPGGFDLGDGWRLLEKKPASRLPAERRLAALGDLSHDDPAARWKAVWDAYPDDPAHFYTYVLAHRSLPPGRLRDFAGTGERLDPDNGWFFFLNAAALARTSIKDNPARAPALRGGAPRTAPPPPGKVIVDPAAFREAEEQLVRALAMPRWDDYRERMREARLEGRTPPRDFTEHSLDQILYFTHPADGYPDWEYVRGVMDWFSVAIEDASRSGDRERLDALTDLFRGTAGKLTVMPWGLPAVRQMFVKTFVVGVARSLAGAYDTLGEAAEALHLNHAADRLNSRKNPRKRPAPDALSELRGSYLVSNAASIRSPDSRPVTEEELRGGRLAEYAMYERLMMHLLALALCATTVFLLCTPLAFRGELGPLPARLADLLTWRDRAVILATAAGVPLLVYGLSTRLPVPGWREFYFSGMGFIAWLVQIAALWLSVVLGSMQVGRWRLARRGAVLAFGWRGFDPGWLCWLLALGMIPVAATTIPEALGRWLGGDYYGILALWVLLGMPAIWLAMMMIVHFNGFHARRLHRTALVHVMIPPVACVALAAAGAIPLIHAEERKWVAEIRFGDPSILDAELAGWIGREVTEALYELDEARTGP